MALYLKRIFGQFSKVIMKFTFYLSIVIGLICLSHLSKEEHVCMHHQLSQTDTISEDFFPTIPEAHYPYYFQKSPSFAFEGFDYPVGKPNGTGYYKALNFGDKDHLGEDWNGKGGGNTDMGDPVYSTGNGLVVFSKKVCCGWGNVIRIVHHMSGHQKHEYIETVYAHLNNLDVQAGEMVRRGQRIGSIGNADGRYAAHLHLEMRDFCGMSLGPGYSDNIFGYLDPSKFIYKNRP